MSVPATPTVEPGFTTTEFWGKCVVQVIALLTLFNVIHISSEQTDAILGLIGLVVPEASYAIARGIRKQGS